jgi:hypothetical protein
MTKLDTLEHGTYCLFEDTLDFEVFLTRCEEQSITWWDGGCAREFLDYDKDKGKYIGYYINDSTMNLLTESGLSGLICIGCDIKFTLY